jgi:hypothetical protein
MQLQGKSKYVPCYKITRIAFAVGYSLRYYCSGSLHQKLGTPFPRSDRERRELPADPADNPPVDRSRRTV